MEVQHEEIKGLQMCQFKKTIIGRPVSAVRPSSVTENLRGRYHTISGYDMLLAIQVTYGQ